MRPGIYTFYHKTIGGYLTFADRTLKLSKTPQPWQLKRAGQKGFYVYAHGTELLLDIDNAWLTPGNRIKLWNLTGYDVQIWTVEKTGRGTYVLVCAPDPRYCLGFEGGRAELQLRRSNAPMQEWELTDVADYLPREYLPIFSKGRTVELQLPLDIQRVICVTRLQEWADRLELAYATFGELVGFVPFETISVEAYKKSPYAGYAGWVFPNSDVIHIDRDFLYGDLRKMSIRREDWNFCALHEMGHMFDFGQPWNFEGELMTDMKIAYVMEKHNAAAAPAAFDGNTCFYGKDIAKAYAALQSDLSVGYDVFACAKRFLDIKETIGWEPFRQTFCYLRRTQKKTTERQALLLFVQTLSRFSGRDIKGYFTAREWNNILRQTET